MRTRFPFSVMDDNIVRLRSSYGWSAVGVYYAVLERLADRGGVYEYVQLLPLSIILNLSAEDLKAHITTFVQLQLLDSDGGRFWHAGMREEVASHARWLAGQREAGKRGAEKRWKKPEKPKRKRKPPEPAFIHLPMTGGRTAAVSVAQVERYKSLYPAVDVGHQLHRMAEWLANRPSSQRAAPSGVYQFVEKWLASEQEKRNGRTDSTAGSGGESTLS